MYEAYRSQESLSREPAKMKEKQWIYGTMKTRFFIQKSIFTNFYPFIYGFQLIENGY